MILRYVIVSKLNCNNDDISLSSVWGKGGDNVAHVASALSVGRSVPCLFFRGNPTGG